MHTVRNRVASHPRHKGKMPPRGSRKKSEPAFMLRSGNPPAFPAGLIIPAPRGAMITAVPWPEIGARETGLENNIAANVAARSKTGAGHVQQQGKARKPKPRKQRPAASRKARPAAKSSPLVTNSLAQDAPVSMMTEDLLDRALAMRPSPAEDTPDPSSALPQAPATAPSASAGATPIPRSHALAPARGQGLFEAIGLWLRDAGNWLTRWNKGRRKAEDRTRVARANARHQALQSQYEALEALRETVKIDAAR